MLPGHGVPASFFDFAIRLKFLLLRHTWYGAMKLSEVIQPDRISVELHSRDKKGVLEELAGIMCKDRPGLDKSAVVKVLVDREQLGSTGIGEGVAIPHGKLMEVNQPMVCFGRSKKGLDFDSMDGQPAHLFFLLLAPENSSGLHLQVLTRIARLLKNSSFRKSLLEARTPDDIYRIILAADDES